MANITEANKKRVHRLFNVRIVAEEISDALSLYSL